MKTVVYKTIETSVMEDWLALWQKSSFANYTNSPSWFHSAIETYQYTDLVIIALYDRDKLVAIGGLVKDKKYGIQIYTVVPNDFVLGNPFLLDTNDKKVTRNFYKELLKLGVVFLTNIPQEQIELKTINIKTQYSTINYFLEVQKDENNAVVVRHKRRLLRRSEMIENDLTLESYKGFDENALKTVLSIDDKSKKEANGYNAFSNKQTFSFYASLAKRFDKQFCIYIMYHKKRPVAYQIAFLVGKTLYCSQIAFLKTYEQYSIGRSLLIRLIEKVGAEGVSMIDFGSGEDHVKRSLTKQYRDLYTVIISNDKFARSVILASFKTRDFLYNQLHKQARFYTFYRKSKNIFFKNQ